MGLGNKWREEAGRILMSALVAVALLGLAFSSVWPMTVNIGADDARFIHNFNAPEIANGADFRWTTGASTLDMLRLSGGARAILALRMHNARPDDQPVPSLQLHAGASAIPAFPVTRAISGMRTYAVLVQGDGRFSWAMPIQFASDKILMPSDPRPLGLVVERATLAPLTGTLPLPTLWLLFWSATLGAFAYALPRAMGLAARRSFELAILLAMLIGLSIALRPLEVLPFIHRIAALLAVGLLGAWLARFLAPPVQEHQQFPGARPALAVRGATLPIYMSVAWWMAPIFQMIMIADGATGVGLAPQTLWIGSVLLVGLAALVGWAVLQGNRALLTRGALALLTVAAVAHGLYLLWYGFTRQAPDFWILFRGVRDWARGGSLYDLVAVNTNHFGHVFKVPPFYGMLFVPFVFKDGLQILFYHRLINMALIGITLLLWYWMWGLKVFSATGLGVLMLLNFRPLTSTLATGQIDLVLLVILILALWALREEQDGLAGALIALGALFKLYPVLLLAFLLAKRRWRGLVGFAVGMLLFNGIALAVMGWEPQRVYLTEVLPKIGGTTAWVENQTIAGFLARLVDTPKDADIFTNRPVELLANVLSVIMIGMVSLLALRPARRATTTYALQYSLFPLLMVLAVPAAWMHYETLLFIPFAALLLHWSDRQIPLASAATLALGFGLVAYGNQWSFYDGTVMGVLTITSISYKFYGMLILGGLIAATLLEERVPAAIRVPVAAPEYVVQR